MKCSFCGGEFHIDQAEEACRSCPINRSCHLVLCPYCGYEMPPEPRLISRLRLLRQHFSNGNGHGELVRSEMIGSMACLNEMKPGQSGEIFELGLQDRKMAQKLVAMNLLPGVKISLLRRSPSYVFEAGFSQFAVDEEIAKLIRVRITSARPLPV